MTRRAILFRWFAMPVLLLAGALLMTYSGHAATGYSQYLRRYPYLTDVVDSYATINWGTDQSNTAGAVRYGKVGSESCTAHYVPASARTVVKVNGISEYQWSAMLNLTPGAQYCYRVYLGSGPATEVDLLGTDASPVFWTQVPSGSTQSYSFVVFGDWGGVDSTGANPYMAKLMSLIASSGARFALAAGDNGYPSGSQTNYGDLFQTGAGISAIFGPSFWKVPGSLLPIFPASGNHGLSNADPNHPLILNFPQTRAVALSGGRYVKETYCCLDGTTSANYPSAWYAFDAGLARIYVLDSSWADTNIGTATSPYQVDFDYHWTPTSLEYQWLRADLASHPSTIKLAMVHYPIYSDDPHQSADTYLQGSGSLEGLLKQYGVNVAFEGHSHTYQRFAASAVGIPSYVTGGGGTIVPLGAVGPCTALDLYSIGYTSKGYSCNAPKPSTPDPVYHFLKVTVNSTSVAVTPINSLGSTFDTTSYPVPSSGDTSAPSVPGNLLAAPSTNGTEVDLSWSASTDNTAVRGYDIYRNGTLISQTDAATLTYADTHLNPATSYTYTVDAFDAAGNHSAQTPVFGATTPSAATYVFNPVADTYVAADNTTTNYGTSVVFKIDGSPDYHSYLRFNVGEISGTVTKATLSLYTTFSSSIGYQVNTVTSNQWDEGTTTYSNAPALGGAVASSGAFKSGSWVSVDVTSLITGNGIYDLAISTTSTSSMSFNSRDAASSWPQLIIQTAVTSPTPTATATSLPTNTPTNTPLPTDTPTATNTPLPTDTPTSTPLPTDTATATNTALPTDTPTSTPLPTDTATATNTALPTDTPTSTPLPTDTPTPTDTPFFVPTDTPTPTYTPFFVSTPTDTPTATATPFFTNTPTPTDTPFFVPTPTDTPTATATPFFTNTPTAMPLFTPTPTQPALPVFSDGFESGNLSAWTTASGLTAESTNVHSGLFAAQGNTTTGATFAKKTLPSTYVDGYSRIYFQLVSIASQVNLLRYRTSTGTSIGYLYVNTSGQLGFHDDATNLNTLSTATLVGPGWHVLELHAHINGTSSFTEVWLDGVLVSKLSFTTDLGTTAVGGFQIGETQTGRTYNVIFDDVVFGTQRIGP